MMNRQIRLASGYNAFVCLARLIPAILFGISLPALAQTTQRPVVFDKIGENAPDFPFYWHWENTPYHPKSSTVYNGKWQVWYFFTPEHEAASNLIDSLNAFRQKNPELEVIGVMCPRFKSDSAATRMAYHLEVLKPEFPVVCDYRFTMWGQLGWQKWPSLCVVSSAGKLEHAADGLNVFDSLKAFWQVRKASVQSGGLQVIDHIPHRHQRAQSIVEHPVAVAFGAEVNQLVVAEGSRNRLVRLDKSGFIQGYIGSLEPGYRDGSAQEARFMRIADAATDPAGKFLYVSDAGSHTIRRIDLLSFETRTVLGDGQQGLEPPGVLNMGLGSLNTPGGLCFVGNDLYFAVSGWNQIWKLNVRSGDAEWVCGSGEVGYADGLPNAASFNQPMGINTSPSGGILIADAGNSAVRLFEKGELTTLCGGENAFDIGNTTGKIRDARLAFPTDVLWWQNQILIADSRNDRLVAVSENGKRLEEPAFALGMDFKMPLALASQNQTLFVAEGAGERLLLYSEAGGWITFEPTDLHRFVAREHRQPPQLLMEVGSWQEEELTPGTVKIKLQDQEGWRLVPDAPNYAFAFCDQTPCETSIDRIQNGVIEIAFPLPHAVSMPQLIVDVRLFFEPLDRFSHPRKYRNVQLAVPMQEVARGLNYEVEVPLSRED